MSKTVNIKANYTFNDLNPLEEELAKLNLTNVPCPVAEISYVPTLPMMENGSTQTDSNEEQRKLFIGSISLTTTGEELKNHFSKYGEVERININYDFKSGQTQGYAYVVFKNKNVVQKVLSSGDSIFDYSSNKNVVEERKKIKARKSKTSPNEAVGSANGKMNGDKGSKKGANAKGTNSEPEKSVEDSNEHSNDEAKQCDNNDNAKKQSRKRKRNKAKTSKQYIIVENIIHLNEKDIASFFAKYNIELYYPIDESSSNKDYCIVMTNDKTQSDAIMKITRPIINGIKLRMSPMRNMPDDYLIVQNRDIEDFKLFYGDIENGEVVLEPVGNSAQ